MDVSDQEIVLKGARVIDPVQGIDQVADVIVADGRIRAVGPGIAPAGSKAIDLTGHYVTPGWIDIHVHAYGTLGFADPDSIGIYQGVTTFVEAGGPGIGTLEEFVALLSGRTMTSLYAGPYLRPMGLIGLNFIEGNVRSLGEVPIAKWIDFAKEHCDLLRYLKIGALGNYGTGPLKIAKGLAEIIGLPLYMHIGEFQQEKPDRVLAMDAFQIAQAGDIITHLYHNNLGRVLDSQGKVLPVVREAERRGVLFDIGFGGYNFSWDVAEKAYAQDLVPHILSSDLQQFNVLGPVYSLANVLSAFLRLGLAIPEIIRRVTSTPARALSLEDRAGSLRPGLPADITVFRLESGEFELSDAHCRTRKTEKRFVPTMAFKNGQRVDSDLTRCQKESNWFVTIEEERIPAAARRLSAGQRKFLAALSDALSTRDWELKSAERLDIEKAIELQDLFHEVRRQHSIKLRDALTAVYDCFVENTFTIQIGLFLLRLDRKFALARINEVACKQPIAA
ncbi:MAG TPA: amidohydrolase family protein [Burkholderiales bacterium]|jgi:dihydroorotase|nr:amidohydrolase family protein [Burkholderiales bacterium]